ncbi:MAG: peptidylprolyl isomerase [Anaerolineaceae bacterium]|nr:peptidylprolyl isomerase [Anaerolineaceae bacterium]
METNTYTVAKDFVVSIDYVLTVDGEIADSSAGREPLPYLHGHDNLIKGLEVELEGMKVGEQKQVVVAPKDGYGEIDPEAFADMERAKFPEGFDLQIGRMIRLNAGDGRVMTAAIAEVNDETVKLDFNHPLAGKSLNFDVTISDIREATDLEITSGHVAPVGGCASCSSGSCGDGGCSSC